MLKDGRMPVADIEAEIRKFLTSRFPLAGNNFHDNAPLLGTVVDSNGVIELIEFLQERFGITIDDEDITMENLDSIKNAAEFVNRKIPGKS
jgi:acyl carrier protein